MRLIDYTGHNDETCDTHTRLAAYILDQDHRVFVLGQLVLGVDLAVPPRLLLIHPLLHLVYLSLLYVCVLLILFLWKARSTKEKHTKIMWYYKAQSLNWC